MNPIRLFIGAMPRSDCLHRLADAAAQYRKQHAGAGLRWLPSSHWHMTLRFLGDSSPEQTNALIELVSSMHIEAPLPALTCNSLGPFPNLQKPTVLAFELETSPPWHALVRCLEQQVSKLGFEKERRTFRPHVSIARLRRREPNKMSIEPIQMDIEFAEMTVFRSHLHADGARYGALQSVSLR